MKMPRDAIAHLQNTAGIDLSAFAEQFLRIER